MTAWIVGTLVPVVLIIIAYRHHDAWWWASHRSKVIGDGSWDRREVSPEHVRFCLGSNDPNDHREFVVLKGHRHFETWRMIVEKELTFGLKLTRAPQRLSLSPIASDYMIPEPHKCYVQDGKSCYELIAPMELDKYPDVPISERQRYHSHS